MKTQIVTRLAPKLLFFLLIGGLAIGSGGCKSKKKLAEEAAATEYADKVAKAIADLEAILTDNGTMPLSEMERRLNDIKAQNLNDQTVNELIEEVEIKIANEKEKLRKLEEEKQKQLELQKELTKYDYINDYFVDIAKAPDAGVANAKISEAMKLYSSEEVPVLIIIHQEGDIVDYDKPTIIANYLNFVKDQKRYDNKINTVKFDGYGQITELELIKK